MQLFACNSDLRNKRIVPWKLEHIRLARQYQIFHGHDHFYNPTSLMGTYKAMQESADEEKVSLFVQEGKGCIARMKHEQVSQ